MTRHEPDGPPLDALRCAGCGAWIIETETGSWGDWDMPTRVFCPEEQDGPNDWVATLHRPDPDELAARDRDEDPRPRPHTPPERFTQSERDDLRDAGRGHLLP